ncbi:MAG: hypothetical protein IJ730_03225 [Alphaproteobacteria bacterium]|nr:hypothetical protein [Alphaproteobacteria bacterium]
MFEVLIRFIRNPETILAEFLKISEVKEAMDELTLISMDKQTRAEYATRVKEMNRIYATERAGFKKGKAEGEKIGIEKNKTKVAKNLIKLCLSIDQIASVTDLFVEKIKNLAE